MGIIANMESGFVFQIVPPYQQVTEQSTECLQTSEQCNIPSGIEQAVRDKGTAGATHYKY